MEEVSILNLGMDEDPPKNTNDENKKIDSLQLLHIVSELATDENIERYKQNPNIPVEGGFNLFVDKPNIKFIMDKAVPRGCDRSKFEKIDSDIGFPSIDFIYNISESEIKTWRNRNYNEVGSGGYKESYDPRLYKAVVNVVPGRPEKTKAFLTFKSWLYPDMAGGNIPLLPEETEKCYKKICDYFHLTDEQLMSKAVEGYKAPLLTFDDIISVPLITRSHLRHDYFDVNVKLLEGINGIEKGEPCVKATVELSDRAQAAFLTKTSFFQKNEKKIDFLKKDYKSIKEWNENEENKISFNVYLFDYMDKRRCMLSINMENYKGLRTGDNIDKKTANRSEFMREYIRNSLIASFGGVYPNIDSSYSGIPLKQRSDEFVSNEFEALANVASEYLVLSDKETRIITDRLDCQLRNSGRRMTVETMLDWACGKEVTDILIQTNAEFADKSDAVMNALHTLSPYAEKLNDNLFSISNTYKDKIALTLYETGLKYTEQSQDYSVYPANFCAPCCGFCQMPVIVVENDNKHLLSKIDIPPDEYSSIISRAEIRCTDPETGKERIIRSKSNMRFGEMLTADLYMYSNELHRLTKENEIMLTDKNSIALKVGIVNNFTGVRVSEPCNIPLTHKEAENLAVLLETEMKNCGVGMPMEFVNDFEYFLPEHGMLMNEYKERGAKNEREGRSMYQDKPLKNHERNYERYKRKEELRDKQAELDFENENELEEDIVLARDIELDM